MSWVSNTVVQRLIAEGVLPATQVVTYAEVEVALQTIRGGEVTHSWGKSGSSSSRVRKPARRTQRGEVGVLG